MVMERWTDDYGRWTDDVIVMGRCVTGRIFL